MKPTLFHCTSWPWQWFQLCNNFLFFELCNNTIIQILFLTKQDLFWTVYVENITEHICPNRYIIWFFFSKCTARGREHFVSSSLEHIVVRCLFLDQSGVRIFNIWCNFDQYLSALLKFVSTKRAFFHLWSNLAFIGMFYWFCFLTTRRVGRERETSSG